MALLQHKVHSHPGAHFCGLKARLAANIGRGGGLDATTKRRLLAKLQTLPNGERLCHGDFHAHNILGSLRQPTLIDWLDASSGAPAADVCRSFVLISHSDPQIASSYVDAYLEASGESRATIFEWLPVVAGARLAEGVPQEAETLTAWAAAP
jgi:aminoglycoside phosphotransferase (APT) family kinase protein